MMRSKHLLIAMFGLLAALSACSLLPTQDGWASVNSRVYYDGNGSASGSVPEDTTLHEAGTTVTVLDNTGALTKTDFAMAGWNTKADGSGTSYQPGDTLKMGTSKITLYADWKKTFTPRFHADDATSGTLPTLDPLTIGDWSYTYLGNPGGLHKPGYIFESWNTKPDGTGTEMSASYPITTIDGTMSDFWIQWQPGVIITYNLNGATETTPPEPTEIPSGSSGSLSDSYGYTKPHYHSDGWNTLPDGSGTSYSDYDYIPYPTEDMSLYLAWTHNAGYHFDANGATSGTVPDDADTPDYYSYVTLPANTGSLSKPGFYFIGWNTSADALGTWSLPGADLYVTTGYNTLYAEWAAVQTVPVDGTFYSISTGSGSDAWYEVSLPAAGTYTFSWKDYYDDSSAYTGNVYFVQVYHPDTLAYENEMYNSSGSYTASAAGTILLRVQDYYDPGTCALKITGP